MGPKRLLRPSLCDCPVAIVGYCLIPFPALDYRERSHPRRSPRTRDQSFSRDKLRSRISKVLRIGSGHLSQDHRKRRFKGFGVRTQIRKWKRGMCVLSRYGPKHYASSWIPRQRKAELSSSCDRPDDLRATVLRRRAVDSDPTQEVP